MTNNGGNIMATNCPNCGKIMDETTTFLSCDECDVFVYKPGYEPTEEFDEQVPEGCAACGGPYPSCKSSCNLFDD